MNKIICGCWEIMVRNSSSCIQLDTLLISVLTREMFELNTRRVILYLCTNVLFLNCDLCELIPG